MKPSQWETLKKCARMERVEPVPVALIVDSPWIPGFAGISTLDYFFVPEIWLAANLQVARTFPDVIFLPGFWVELGMAAEPSGFGCRVSFYPDRTPLVHPLFTSLEAVQELKIPNPLTDGFMPMILNTYRWAQPRLGEAGYSIKLVAARGPLAIATHLMGVSEFLIGIKIEPEKAHQLLKLTTALSKAWLQAQAEAIGSVEGILLLDDIAGFLSPDDYLEFAHPYLDEIYKAFPGCLKLFHNDMDNMASFRFLESLSVDIFNFTHKFDLGRVRQEVGPQVCLMGNVPPLEVLTQGSREDVFQAAQKCLQVYPSESGLILSAGGGVSPGTPGENIQALVEAAQISLPVRS